MAQQGLPILPAANAAGPPQPLPAIVAAPPPPRTFRELFASMPDEYNGQYHGLLHEVRATPEVGADAVLNYAIQFPSELVPSVWLYQDHQRGHIQTLILPHAFPTIPGAAQNRWSNTRLAFGSDVNYGQIAPVNFPRAICEISARVRVPTVANMLPELGANPDRVILGPYREGAEDTEVITSRGIVPVPKQYIDLVLFRDLPPRDAWMQLGEAIIADQRQEDCAILLNFLRAALVWPEPPAPAAPPAPVDIEAQVEQPEQPPPVDGPINAEARDGRRPFYPPVVMAPVLLQPVIPDEPLHAHIWRRLLQYLPALGVPDTQAQASQQLLQSTIVLRDAMQVAADGQQVRAAPDAGASSFTKVFPGMAPCLRKLCGAGDDDELLPLFWRTFAATGGKRNQCSPQLESLINQRALEPDSTQTQQVLGVRLYEGLQQFRVGTNSLEELTYGISPFLICPAGYHKAAAQRAATFLYTSIQGEGCVATLDNVKVLVTTTINVPDNFYQLVDFIGAYSIMIDVLTGPNEILAQEVRQHFHFWKFNVADVVAAISHEPKAVQSEFLVGVMRAIQLTVLRHINEKMNLNILRVSPPDFQHIEDAVHRRTFKNMPSLPAAYYSEVKPADRADAAAAAGLPPSAATPTAKSERTKGNMVTATGNQVNTAWQERLANSGKTILALKALGAKHLPASADKTTKICLSFHLKANCFDNCRCSSTHRKLSDAETKTMDAFVKKHL